MAYTGIMCAERNLPATLFVSSLSALLAGLACSPESLNQIVYIPVRREKGAVSKHRNIQIQEKIVKDIADALNLGNYLTSDLIDARQQFITMNPKIIDVNSVGYLNLHAKELENVDSFIGAGSEILSPFTPRIPRLNIQDFRLRVAIVRSYFFQFGIQEVRCFVENNRRSFLFWKARPISKKEYTNTCFKIFHALRVHPDYEFLQDLASTLEKNPSSKFLVILPVAAHYGGDETDTQINLARIFKAFPDETFITLVKNHPSDGRFVPEESRLDGVVHWDSDIARTFPIEILLNVFQDRLVLVSAGSSAMFTIENGIKFMFYPNSAFGRKLAKRNSKHLLRSYGIKTIKHV